MTTKHRNVKKSQAKKFHFSYIDWIFIVFGVVVSTITVFSEHDYSLLYTVASILSLNCSVLEIILSINGRRSNYIFAIINSVTDAIIAFLSQFYGNMVISLYYIPISIIGFRFWGKHSDKNNNVVARKLTVKQAIVLILSFAVLSIGLGVILMKIGGQSIILDSTTTILVIISSILMVLRYYESWLLWVITDVFLLVLFLADSNPAVVAMRVFNVLTSVYGYINWRKMLKKKH